MGELGKLLFKEDDHAHLCNLGVWYWQLGHYQLAAACYRRSIEIHPEPPTCMNLAVCLDDMANRIDGDTDEIRQIRAGYVNQVVEVMKAFYELSTNETENSIVEDFLMKMVKAIW